MAVLGDSISTGMNVSAYLKEAKDLTWSTGKNLPASHFSRFQSELGVTKIAAHNVAKAAVTSFDLGRQIDAIDSDQLDYVTMQIGANDLCLSVGKNEDQLNSYGSRIESAIDKLINRYPDVKILLTPVPYMNRLVELYGNNFKCKLVWASAKNFGLSCDSLLGRSANQSSRQKFEDYRKDLNEQLGEVAKRYPDNVSFNPGIGNTSFEKSHISNLDCFHPDKEGQSLIADKTWDKSFAESALFH